MDSADSSEGDLHRGSWVREHALWLIMTAIGTFGAIITSLPLEAPDTDVQIYITLVESQELFFWLYLMVAGMGVFLIATAEINRRVDDDGI